MVLDPEMSKKICDYVYTEPRTIQDISEYLGKNWKTAERYVQKISKEQGTLLMKTFRGGTRGALKVVFWANTDKICSTEFQEHLLNKIKLGRKKQDFSPLDIYQYVDEDKRNAFSCKERLSFGKEFIELLKKAEHQVLSFSGNISWINFEEEGTKVEEIVEELMKRDVKFKVVSRVDIASVRNINKLLDIQNRLGKDLVEVRHSEQPLRAFVIDHELARFKEAKDPGDYKPGELDSKIYIYYELYDPEWMNKLFYSLFRHSIDYKKRLDDLKSIGV